MSGWNNYGSGYLRLFYEDYIMDTSTNPYQVIAEAKQQIKRDALHLLEGHQRGNELFEQEFQALYELTESNEFADAGIVDNLEKINLDMSNFDAAIGKLKELVSDSDNVGAAVEEGNKVIESIDSILEKGAALQGLGDSAYTEIYNFKQKMKKVCYTLKYIKDKNLTLDGRKDLLNQIKAIQSNVSGYMLELALVYAFIGSNEYGLNEIHQAMINIGGHTGGLRAQMKISPYMEEDLKKLKQALSQNGSIQSKADVVFHLLMGDGNGEVSSDSGWVGFQAKNVGDIKKAIHVGNYTLESIGIDKYYDQGFLVNIVGSLAGDSYRQEVPKEKRRFKGTLSSQGAIDTLWQSIKNSTKWLGAADAIAGAANANISNQVSYYIIRDKGSGHIKVIAVSKIFNKIIEAIKAEQEYALGINTGLADFGTGRTRSHYFSINVNAYSENKTPTERSSEAWPKIWEAIQQTKVSIAINFSSFFTNL